MLTITSFTHKTTFDKVQKAVHEATKEANEGGHNVGYSYVHNRKGQPYLMVSLHVGLDEKAQFYVYKGTKKVNVSSLVYAGLKRGQEERRRERLRSAMLAANDYFEVTFSKKDGSERTLTGFIDTDNNKEAPTTSHLPQYQVCYDVDIDQPRNVNLDKVSSLIVDGKEVA